MVLKGFLSKQKTLLLVALILFATPSFAFVGGSISGTIKDTTGGVIPGAKVTAINTALRTEFTTLTNEKGYFSFLNLAVGRYDLTVELTGFKPQKRAGLTIDIDTALEVNMNLEVGDLSQEISVSENLDQTSVQPETISTHLGEVVVSTQIEALPLNGRSYTDLLAIQPGVTPVTTLTSTSVIMAGVVGTINPSGDQNAGDVSIDGQRESSNGFMVNGVDVQEHMNGGTSVIPNLDSIAEFRVLTNNFDPEYGNYNGGMINVVSKSGSNAFHGDAFEFLRNTSMDSRNFFSDTRGVFRQNQFGGVVGGPVRKDKIFFFGDYQGTRTTQGIASPATTVFSLPNRNGDFSDSLSSLTGTVGGPHTASLLSQALGYNVYAGECYTPACPNPNKSGQYVFPNGFIPKSAWSAPAGNLLKYIPLPNIGSNQFATSSAAETVRDDKGAARIDANTRWGQLSGYYFVDDYQLDNPYPGQQGGASIPGFDALSIGRAQLFSLGWTRSIGSTAVNEFRVGLLRNVNNIGQPHGGAGVTIASQGFVTGVGTPGIVVQAPRFEGVENIVFPSFVMGVPVTNVDQWNNTLFVSNSFSKLVKAHSLKFGGQFHLDQVNEDPNGTFNGTFVISGTETGNPFADFLLGFPSNFTQTDGPRFYLRNRYGSVFGEDSWKARSNLTVNLGLRWDVIMPWWEKYNSIQTVVPGMQSVLYPNAIPGLVVPGDPGIPSTISPTKWANLAPRVGMAYSPNFQSGLLKTLAGGAGKTSIRASYGIFYTAFQGLSTGIMYGVAPFGYNYLTPAPPLLATPFINAGDGTQNVDPFPLTLPPHNVSARNPFTGFNFAAAIPDNADPYFYYRNSVPYTENYMLSIQRQIGTKALLTVSYAGNQGHRLMSYIATNTGNPALCLSLNQPSQVAPGSATCGPFGEDAAYTSASGQVFKGTRTGLGSNYASVTAGKTIGNSNYNALETNLRLTLAPGSTVLFAYTYSKSIDQGSNIGETLNPINQRLTRNLSSWDMTHNFVTSYSYALPFDRLFRSSNAFTTGWALAGTTRFSTGFPVDLEDDSDRSLLGTLGNGVNNHLLDTPRLLAGPLQINTDPRKNPYGFNTGVFAQETLGQLGNSARRFFHGPGINNWDMQISKTLYRREERALNIRVEAFNLFNHAQFYGPTAVDGEINDPNFGRIVSAAPPRRVQIAAKLSF